MQRRALASMRRSCPSCGEGLEWWRWFYAPPLPWRCRACHARLRYDLRQRTFAAIAAGLWAGAIQLCWEPKRWDIWAYALFIGGVFVLLPEDRIVACDENDSGSRK